MTDLKKKKKKKTSLAVVFYNFIIFIIEEMLGLMNRGNRPSIKPQVILKGPPEEKEQRKKKIVAFYKSRSDQCMGAVRVDNALGFFDSKERKSFPTHDILMELEQDRVLKRCNFRKGFKYACD